MTLGAEGIEIEAELAKAVAGVGAGLTKAVAEVGAELTKAELAETGLTKAELAETDRRNLV